MQRANCYHIANVLVPLDLLAKAERERIAQLDDADKAAFKDVMSKYVLPTIVELSSRGRSLLKDSLRYCLRTRPAAVRKMVDNLQDSPVGGIDDPYPMMEALWEVAFPDERYATGDLAAYIEDHNRATGNEIYAPESGWPERP